MICNEASQASRILLFHPRALEGAQRVRIAGQGWRAPSDSTLYHSLLSH